MNSNLHSQEFWDQGYSDLKLEEVSEKDQIRNWLKHWLKTIPVGSCLEIGCFPGRYLAFFGRLGFELNGVDLTPRTEPEVANWLRSEGYSVGQVAYHDFFTWAPNKKFDVVYSNGFIEHFSNWQDALRRHTEFVAPGGYLLVTAPNFKGTFQKFFHWLVDKENMDRHYLPSMDPDLWVAELQKDGFEILHSGFFERFDFWVGVQNRNLFQKLIFWTLRALIPVLKWILPKNSYQFSPYCGVVARKPVS